MYKAKKLREFCERAICMNSKGIFESEGFLNAPYDVVLQIMSLDSLICDEIEAFAACLAWARTTCQRNDLNPNESVQLRSVLREILRQIRFGSMKIEEFGALLHKYPDLFTEVESNEIIFIMSQLNGFKPKIFNGNPRIQQASSDERDWLCCRRLIKQNDGHVIQFSHQINRFY